jgi:hypothetical protein
LKIPRACTIKLFYGRNCCRILVILSVCHCNSHLNIIDWMAIANTPAYYDTATITAAKSFKIQDPRAKLILSVSWVTFVKCLWNPTLVWPRMVFNPCLTSFLAKKIFTLRKKADTKQHRSSIHCRKVLTVSINKKSMECCELLSFVNWGYQC